MNTEQWRPIEEFEGFYKVSNFGHIRSLDRVVISKRGIPMTFKGKELKCFVATNGYKNVILKKSGIEYPQIVHRIVAKAFLPNPNNLPQVNHKNEVKTDNRVSNLEWCDVSYNAKYKDAQKRRYKNGGGRRKRPVNQFTTDGRFLRTFQSIAEAAKAVGAKQNAITHCCQGRFKTSMGYRWRYADTCE